MTGLRLSLPNVTFAGSSASIIPEIDPVVPTTGGILLIDVNHPLGGFPSGVPTDGVAVTNLLRDKLATLGAISDKSSLDSPQRVVAMTSTTGKVERTTLGGIHAIQATTQTSNYQGYSLGIGAGVISYMKANLAHSFYVSQWARPTKLPTWTPGYTWHAGIVETSAAVAYGLGLSGAMAYGSTNLLPTLAGKNISTTAGWDGSLNVPLIRAVAMGALPVNFGTNAVQSNGYAYSVFEVGQFHNLNISNGTDGKGKHGAQVFYRAYIEDLTVSGRSYATAYALDQAEFAKQVLTSGGRYYDDTIPTDPTTFA